MPQVSIKHLLQSLVILLNILKPVAADPKNIDAYINGWEVEIQQKIPTPTAIYHMLSSTIEGAGVKFVQTKNPL